MLIDWIVGMMVLTGLVLLAYGVYWIYVWANRETGKIAAEHEEVFTQLAEWLDKPVTDPRRLTVIVFAGNHHQFTTWLHEQQQYERYQCLYINRVEQLYGIRPERVHTIVLTGSYWTHPVWHTEYARTLVREWKQRVLDNTQSS